MGAARWAGIERFIDRGGERLEVTQSIQKDHPGVFSTYVADSTPESIHVRFTKMVRRIGLVVYLPCGPVTGRRQRLKPSRSYQPQQSFAFGLLFHGPWHAYESDVVNKKRGRWYCYDVHGWGRNKKFRTTLQ